MQAGLADAIKDKVGSTYFGLPGRINTTYETDPAKIANTTTLSGALGGLVRAAVGGMANLGIRAYNAVAATGVDPRTADQRNADFAAEETRRYQSPTTFVGGGMRAAATAPAAQPMTTSWEPSPLPVRSQVAPPTGGLRRAAAQSAVSQPDEEGLRSASSAAPGPMVTEMTDAEGVMPASIARQLPATSSGDLFAADGTNGGFAFTTNPDGTVGQMFGLRQRTPEEDKAYAAQAAAQPAVSDVATPPASPAPGTPGWAGSQAEWEYNHHLDSLLNRPLGLRVLAQMIAKQNADTIASHYATEDMRSRALLPGDVETQRSQLATAAGLRGKTAAETTELNLKNQAFPAVTAADLGLKSAQAKEALQRGSYFASRPEEIQGRIDAMAEKNAFSLQAAQEKIKQAQEGSELKTLAAGDPNFTAKFGALGGNLATYKAAEELAAAGGFEYKPKPFKTGVIGMRTTHPAGWYDADGNQVQMGSLAAALLAKRSGK